MEVVLVVPVVLVEEVLALDRWVEWGLGCCEE